MAGCGRSGLLSEGNELPPVLSSLYKTAHGTWNAFPQDMALSIIFIHIGFFVIIMRALDGPLASEAMQCSSAWWFSQKTWIQERIIREQAERILVGTKNRVTAKVRPVRVMPCDPTRMVSRPMQMDQKFPKYSGRLRHIRGETHTFNGATDAGPTPPQRCCRCAAHAWGLGVRGI